MVYKNLINRMFISIAFIFLYLLLSFTKFEYVFYLIIIIYLLILLEVIQNFKKFKYFIILYLFISIYYLFNINFNNENYIKFNLMVITIITFDIFSYIVGTIYGKNKIFPYISPNKTLEGLIGGTLFSIFISLIYVHFFKIPLTIYLIIFVLIIICSSLLGDIIESVFKRINNLKNSSTLLPGHGGFFDRFDSFVLSIILYSILNKYL